MCGHEQFSQNFVCVRGLVFHPSVTFTLEWVLNVKNQPFSPHIKMMFAGKNFLRPNQMNINVATWGRLMKRALPQNGTDTDMSMPQDKITSPGMTFWHLAQFHYHSIDIGKTSLKLNVSPTLIFIGQHFEVDVEGNNHSHCVSPLPPPPKKKKSQWFGWKG